MKKLIVIVILLSSAVLCAGQKVNKAEYFVDTDPGFGKATNIPVSSPANDLSLSFSVNISTLPEGFHIIVLRARDETGHWSVTRQQVFYVYRPQSSTLSNITKAEYFVDTDPGFGKATNIPVSVPAKDVAMSFSVNISTLAEGFHIIVLRARDGTGHWSVTRQQVFYVYKAQSVTLSNITKAEYFIDTDPGFGKATSITISAPEKDVALSFSVNITSLAEGFHIIVLRAGDGTGHWSITRQQVFYVFRPDAATASNITGIEYFIDTDPGFGKGTLYSIPSPASKVTAEFTASLTGVTNGSHVIYFRARDASGRWSHLYSHAVSVTISGIGNLEATSWFRMYPNPNTGDFIMDFADLQGNDISVTITDMGGRVVYSGKLSGESVSLSVDLPSGIYMVMVEAGGRSFMQKLLISR
jgi:hypothetical protein